MAAFFAATGLGDLEVGQVIAGLAPREAVADAELVDAHAVAVAILSNASSNERGAASLGLNRIGFTRATTKLLR